VTRLSDAKIRAAKPGSPSGAWLADGGGLYLRVTPQGSKSFYLRRKSGQRRIQKSLGRWPSLSLSEARKLAFAFDPDAAPRLGMTLGELLDRYEHEQVLPRHKRPELFVTYKRVATEALGTIPLDRLTTAHLTELISRYAAEHGRRTADSLRSQLRMAIGWAHEMGWMDNIAAGITKRVTGYEYRPRTRHLSDDEIRGIWRSDGKHTPLLRGLLLTGLRISELQLSRREDLEQTSDGLILKIPARRSKTNEAHWVLITPTVEAQFDGTAGFLFATRGATGTQAWVRRFCQREGITAWTPHDLRRTFATRLSELGTAPHVAEKMLNHRMQGVMAVYNQAEYREERLAAYQLWERTLNHLIENAGRG
jgi:integrase